MRRAYDSDTEWNTWCVKERISTRMTLTERSTLRRGRGFEEKDKERDKIK